MTPVARIVPQPPSRGGLIAFGVISIVIGSLAGCFSLMMPLAMLAMKSVPNKVGEAKPGTLVVGLIVYVLIATGFLGLGIGSCKCRRWVRPLVLCIAWPWLIGGLLGSLIAIPMLSNMPLPENANVPTPTRTIMMTVTGTTLAVIYVILPLAYILFYQRRSVRETLIQCDPRPRWTDRCPIPVLGLSFWMLLGGLGNASFLQFMCFPFFGIYLTGLPAAVIILGLGAAMVYAAWACYHLNLAGWWTALVVVLFGSVSYLITFQISGITELYRHLGVPETQMKMLEQQNFLHGPVLLLMGAFFSAVYLAFLWYVRRYFVPARRYP